MSTYTPRADGPEVISFDFINTGVPLHEGYERSLDEAECVPTMVRTVWCDPT